MDESFKYSVKNDIIFKYLFPNDIILKDFLEAVLDIEIFSVEVKEQFSASSTNFYEKICYIDLRAVINDKYIVDIEMQREIDKNFLKRIIVYRSTLSKDQLKSGESYMNLKDVISINIIEKSIIKDIDEIQIG